jgi:hypothetical protein
MQVVRRSKMHIRYAVIALGIVPAMAQNFPNFPEPLGGLRFSEVKPFSLPKEIPAHVAQRLGAASVTLTNDGASSVVLFALRYVSHGPTGESARPSKCASFALPEISPRSSVTTTINLGSADEARLVFDLVLLDDGTFYGENRCGTLAKQADQVASRYGVLRAVLLRLQQDGPEKTTAWIQEQLAKPSTFERAVERARPARSN